MKKRLLVSLLIVIFILSGCALPEQDLNNIEESYSSLVRLPYSQLIGKNTDEVTDITGKLIYNEEENIYYMDKQLMEFTPYFILDKNNVIKVSGFETKKNVDDELIQYVSGIVNLMFSYYGSVAIDPDITKRVIKLNDISMCKDNEEFLEKWNYNGYPVELSVKIKKDTAIIRFQYNKL
ncbi:MAG: hypothetical protein E7405_04910 [Ruminococcaceae bacterium]|nr:hypothetical protein [Oscillospiraceae bacterium]